MGSINNAQGMASPTIPIVDFSRWHEAKNNDERLSVAKELIDGCRSIGFVYIINHGLPEELLNEVFAMLPRLFNLPYEDKMKAAHPPGATIHRGYTEPGRMKEGAYDDGDDAGKSKKTTGDFKEMWDMGCEEHTSQPNLWLAETILPGFKDLALEFFWQCNTVAQAVLEAVAIGIGLEDPQRLVKSHSGLYNHLKLSHYPKVPAPLLEGKEEERMGAHTDFSTLTLVFQDDCGGLQVKNPYKDDKTFIEATPIKGACVMNVGDPLMRWSNDFLLSNYHRVGMPPLPDRVEGDQRMTRERYSIPYFVVADPETVIETFDTCIDVESPAKYEPITVGEYMKERFAQYTDNAVGEAA